MSIKYQSGFGSHFATESLPGALPVGQNSPQVCPYGLYAEQHSGTAFTALRHKNQFSWLYRIQPSVIHSKYHASPKQPILTEFNKLEIEPNQLRWSPMELPSSETRVDFVDGMRLVCGAGDPSLKTGCAIYNYAFNANMGNKAFFNSDGDFLIVPQQGALLVKTEMGKLAVAPREILVVPRGIKFTVDIDLAEEGASTADGCRGYIVEIFEGHFELPSLGPIGANGLANPRDFLYPVAWFEDVDHTADPFILINKFQNKLFQFHMPHSPYNVVAWHGNYSPYKYDLRNFNTVNSVSFDHLDPSIFTVLTCPTAEPGVAVVDFVIFPPRKYHHRQGLSVDLYTYLAYWH
jgi:homogentisate 1,2-dioxygenase